MRDAIRDERAARGMCGPGRGTWGRPPRCDAAPAAQAALRLAGQSRRGTGKRPKGVLHKFG